MNSAPPFEFPAEVDVLVVGGGIQGAGIALDLATRGLSVLLIERGDWAGATSSASSRLVHGGLRYLEQFEFALVRDSCLERALLLENAAGFVWPEEFHFPLFRGGPKQVGRAKLMAGLWLYTALATPRALGLPRMRSKAAMCERLPLIQTEGLVGGGSYIDAATDDARLSLAVVQTARREGALAKSRVELLGLEQGADGVRAQVRDLAAECDLELRAGAVVLAGGPATDELRGRAGFADAEPWLAPTRGSHIVVTREKLPTDGAAIFTSSVDGRVMFAIPWPRHTVIGTTDLDVVPGRTRPRATGAEVRYLLDSANGLCPGAKLEPSDVISTWSGLRPLLAPEVGRDGAPSERSREERIDRDGRVFTIAGGKLTGYRSAAEKVGHQVARALGHGDSSKRSRTRTMRLVGALAGSIPRPAWSRLHAGAPRDLDALGVAWAARYGTGAAAVRSAAAQADGLQKLDPVTLLGELDYAVSHEDAASLNDFLFRRTDLGLTGLPLLPSAAERSAMLEHLAKRMGQLLGWTPGRCAQEVAQAQAELERRTAWASDAPFE